MTGKQSVPRPVEEQPIPTVRVGGSSGSGTRSGVGSRASETNTDDREAKRFRFTERRGEKRQGGDVEEMAAKAEEQHLDADVKVPAHKTRRVEDVVADAADAAPEQMNSFVQSKTEVFEKIEESLRPLCTVEILNDDEIMELCILSNQLNACEATAILNPSKFASCAKRLGLREGFEVGLTTEPTERCGTSVLKMTKQNSDECRIENSLNFLWEVRQVMSFLLC